MKTRFLMTVLIILTVITGIAPLALAQSPLDTLRFQMPAMTAVGAGDWLTVGLYGVTTHSLTYTAPAAPSALTLSLECSKDNGVTVFSQMGTSTVTTGATLTGSGECTHVRANLSAMTGTGRLLPVYFGTGGRPTVGGVALGDPAVVNRIRCVVATSVATTLTAVGGSCVAPGAALSLYVTDIYFSASAAGIGADAFPTLKYGTGGTCGTGTTVFWGALTAAAIVAQEQFLTPLKLPPNNEVCWISSTAGSKFLVISGYIAP